MNILLFWLFPPFSLIVMFVFKANLLQSLRVPPSLPPSLPPFLPSFLSFFPCWLICLTAQQGSNQKKANAKRKVSPARQFHPVAFVSPHVSVWGVFLLYSVERSPCPWPFFFLEYSVKLSRQPNQEKQGERRRASAQRSPAKCTSTLIPSFIQIWVQLEPVGQ